jgi:hypothetical protein
MLIGLCSFSRVRYPPLRGLLGDRILWSAGYILGSWLDGPSSRPDLVHHAGARRARHARGNLIPDSRCDRGMKLDSNSELAHLKVTGA